MPLSVCVQGAFAHSLSLALSALDRPREVHAPSGIPLQGPPCRHLAPSAIGPRHAPRPFIASSSPSAFPQQGRSSREGADRRPWAWPRWTLSSVSVPLWSPVRNSLSASIVNRDWALPTLHRTAQRYESATNNPLIGLEKSSSALSPPEVQDCKMFVILRRWLPVSRIPLPIGHY
jgi:hypothetical protein